jgi:hypothetical protein
VWYNQGKLKQEHTIGGTKWLIIGF